MTTRRSIFSAIAGLFAVRKAAAAPKPELVGLFMPHHDSPPYFLDRCDVDFTQDYLVHRSEGYFVLPPGWESTLSK